MTAVVRGDAVVDLDSPGGSRRFDARGIRPWLLAEFHDVAALRITGAGAPLEPLRGGESRACTRGRACVRPSVEWTTAAAPDPTTPVTVCGTAPRIADAVFAPAHGHADNASRGRANRRRRSTPTRFCSARSRADADTVMVPRRRPGSVDGDSTAAAAPAGAGSASGPHTSAGAPVLHRDRRLRAALVSDVPRVRIAGGPVRTVTAPVLIGRRPSPPRLAVGGAESELVAVESPGRFVSATHLELRVEGTRLVATDLRSTNGTTLRSTGGGRRRLRSGESIVVIPGVALDLGDDTIIEILPAPEAAIDDPTRQQASQVTQIGNGNARHRVSLPDGTEITLAWAAMTDTGLRREVNEDSFIAQAPLFAVADGMGGHAAGDFASAAVVTRLAEHGGKPVVGTGDIDASLHSGRSGHEPRRRRDRRGQRHDGDRRRARHHLR